LWSQFEKDEELKLHRRKDIMTKLLSFDEIYELKLEME
jgi:hypothetical protein